MTPKIYRDTPFFFWSMVVYFLVFPILYLVMDIFLAVSIIFPLVLIGSIGSLIKDRLLGKVGSILLLLPLVLGFIPEGSKEFLEGVSRLYPYLLMLFFVVISVVEFHKQFKQRVHVEDKRLTVLKRGLAVNAFVVFFAGWQGLVDYSNGQTQPFLLAIEENVPFFNSVKLLHFILPVFALISLVGFCASLFIYLKHKRYGKYVLWYALSLCVSLLLFSFLFMLGIAGV